MTSALQAPPGKKQRSGYSDENQRWLKLKAAGEKTSAALPAAATPRSAKDAPRAQPPEEVEDDSDSGEF